MIFISGIYVSFIWCKYNGRLRAVYKSMPVNPANVRQENLLESLAQIPSGDEMKKQNGLYNKITV